MRWLQVLTVCVWLASSNVMTAPALVVPGGVTPSQIVCQARTRQIAVSTGPQLREASIFTSPPL